MTTKTDTAASDVRSMHGLGGGERAVLRLLAEAWGSWVDLGEKHPDDDAEMRRAIHAAQMLVAGRVARRVNPDVWWQHAEPPNSQADLPRREERPEGLGRAMG